MGGLLQSVTGNPQASSHDEPDVAGCSYEAYVDLFDDTQEEIDIALAIAASMETKDNPQSSDDGYLLICIWSCSSKTNFKNIKLTEERMLNK